MEKKICASRVFNAEKKIYSCNADGYKECSYQCCNKEKVQLDNLTVEYMSDYITHNGYSTDLEKVKKAFQDGFKKRRIYDKKTD